MKSLEEAAENYVKNKAVPLQEVYTKAFIEGANWQQEQDNEKYTEKEVFELLNNFNKHTLQLQKLKLGNSFNVEDWFEQFKKK